MKRLVIATVAATLSLPAFAQQSPPPSSPGTGMQDRGTSSSGSQQERMSSPSGTQKDRMTSPSTSGSHSGAMGSGSGGHAASLDSSTVRQLQQALKGKGHDPGPIDGMMGSQTQAALRDFQRAEGIDASGQPNASTLSALGVSPQGSRGIGGSNGSDRPGATGGSGGTTGGSGGMAPQNDSGTSRPSEPSGSMPAPRTGSGGVR